MDACCSRTILTDLFTEKIGGKLVLGIPLFTAGLLSFLTPVAAKELGYGAVIALRILIGMCEVIVPFLSVGYGSAQESIGNKNPEQKLADENVVSLQS